VMTGNHHRPRHDSRRPCSHRGGAHCGGRLAYGRFMIYILLVVAAIVCAARAMAVERILSSAIFLAAVSALTAVLLYMQGAYQVAVIELSVGAAWSPCCSSMPSASRRGDPGSPPIVPRTLAAFSRGDGRRAGGSVASAHAQSGVTVSAPLSGALWGSGCWMSGSRWF